ncbi:MAG: presqualene diphosphate synthase HpnD [Caulobacteraceae bacterium]|nr:presqualene diphosphate synthase HpnD [Caulobacteraceae bacterium]
MTLADDLASEGGQARGSSFYAAMRLMPRAEREAMFAVYAFCRKVDDIADEPGPTRDERRALLDGWRADIEALCAGGPGGQAVFLAQHVARFGLAREDFLAVIDGMAMDVERAIVAPPFAELELYCDRVASAVGRLSVRVFGMDHAEGLDLARHLGLALQFTNILRDLDEDAAAGRLYLPAEALDGAGLATGAPATVVDDPRVDRACRWLAERAHAHYRAAETVMRRARQGRLRAPRLMAAVYGALLRRMEAEGWAPPCRRARLGKAALAWIVLTRGLAA